MPDPIDSSPQNLSWLPAVLLVILGSVVGIIALALFCYACGLNFHDEGWSSAEGQTAQTKEGPLVASLAATIIATVLFWWGFVKLTRHQRHEPS